MQPPELISIQKYASKHHISIFSVIKKTMCGELPTVIKEENGKEVTYIALPSSTLHSLAEASKNAEENIEIDYKKEYDDLHKEYLILKTKYERLQKQLSV